MFFVGIIIGLFVGSTSALLLHCLIIASNNNIWEWYLI